MAKSIDVFVTDKNKFMELDLVPENTNNTWDSNDEIEHWNNGNHEDAGFHWNEDEDRWETEFSNYEWWKELGDARNKAYKELGYDDDLYIDFEKWFRNEYSGTDLEMEFRMPKYIDEYLSETENQ